MKRSAIANWSGDGMTGQGDLSTQSGVFNKQSYSFKTRFGSEDGKAGTNPEELIAAAHAGCYSMALSFMISGAGFKVESINTEASVEMQKNSGHFEIVGIQLNLKARIPSISKSQFLALAEKAKSDCPVSKALSAVKITLQAELQ